MWSEGKVYNLCPNVQYRESTACNMVLQNAHVIRLWCGKAGHTVEELLPLFVLVLNVWNTPGEPPTLIAIDKPLLCELH